MREIHYPFKLKQTSKSVLAMGFFDGVHKGHQKVIETAKQKAKELNLPLYVLTYDPHPSVLFGEQINYHLLSPNELRDEMLKNLGVDEVFVLNFTSRLAKLKPQEFTDEVIMQFNPKVVVAGFDHTYGSDKAEANMEKLADYAKDRFAVEVVDELANAQAKISSTAIRNALKTNDLKQANELLGYDYITTGIVVRGDARGRLLGYPTANIYNRNQQLLPAEGVYAVQIEIAKKRYAGMASIGRNITFEENRPITVEVNIFDFNDEIYGEKVKVYWQHFLRLEKKFDSVDDLIIQLKKDEQASKELLKAEKKQVY